MLEARTIKQPFVQKPTYPVVERKHSSVFNAAQFTLKVCRHGMILISYFTFHCLTMPQWCM